MTHRDDQPPPFDDAAREREWLAQEHALRSERLQLGPAGDDARSGRYRLLSRVLRQPPAASLPANFAQQMAARVAAMAVRPGPVEPRFEFVLTLALGLALLITAGVVAALYGNTWLPSFNALLSTAQATTNGWLWALSGCLGASWLLGHWQAGVEAATPHRSA